MQDGNPRYRDPDWLRREYIDEQRTQRDIADECGVSHTTIQNWLENHSIKRKWTPPREVRDTERYDARYHSLHWLVRQYHERGRSQREIADECGVSHTTIQHWFERHNIPVELPDESPQPSDPHNPHHDPDWCWYQYVVSARSQRDIADECGVSHTTIQNWLDGHGIESRTGSPAENVAREVSRERDYGPNWPRKRQQCLQRDEFTCQDCGKTQSELAEVGKHLHVHHITPARRFGDAYLRMNDLDNLVSFCPRCHRKWEGIPLRPR